jgi:hypothetical protein
MIRCCRCRYDLRGTDPTSQCPECGTSVASSIEYERHKARRVFWRILRTGLVAALTIAALAVIASGHSRHDDFLICPDCGRHQSRTYHEYEVPFTSLVLCRFQPRGSPAISETPMTELLDPDGKCAHEWLFLSRSSYHTLRYWVGGPLGYGSLPFCAFDPDFRRFLSDKPRIVEELPSRIRQSWRNRDHTVRDWLESAFDTWWEADRAASEGAAAFRNCP